MKNIYLIKRINASGCDTYSGHVVIADDKRSARKMCPYADEGDIWTKARLVTVEKIGTTNLTPRVVLSEFNSG